MTMVKFKLFRLIPLAFLLGCTNKETIYVVVPNINPQINISSSLTYAETIITNITSARLVRIDQNLNTVKQALGKVEKVSGSNYIIHLNKDYRSFRGEKVTAQDLEYTFQYYVSNNPNALILFGSLEGFEECSKEKNCENLGVRAINEMSVEISLNEKNSSFINDITSPTFMILKKGKPIYETVGECKLPYQLGKGAIRECDSNRVLIETDQRIFSLSKSGSEDSYKITTDGPRKSTPSLTTVFFIKNPDAPKEVQNLISSLNRNSKNVSKELGVPHSATLTSKWMGFESKDLGFKNSNKENLPKKLKLVIAESIPNISSLKRYVSDNWPSINFEFAVVKSQNYFAQFKKADLGLLWLTPGYFDFYDLMSIFDCDPKRLCWFDFKDPTMQALLRDLRKQENRFSNQKVLRQLEEHLQNAGYLAPVGFMNWWLQKGNKRVLTHPAGLFQIDLTELAYD